MFVTVRELGVFDTLSFHTTNLIRENKFGVFVWNNDKQKLRSGKYTDSVGGDRD